LLGGGCTISRGGGGGKRFWGVHIHPAPPRKSVLAKGTLTGGGLKWLTGRGAAWVLEGFVVKKSNYLIVATGRKL
jgi:hypothetical protein